MKPYIKFITSNNVKVFYILTILLTGIRCSKPQDETVKSLPEINIRYAERFTIKTNNNEIVATVKLEAGQEQQYIFHKKDSVQEKSNATASNTIEVPLEKVVCLASPHICLINSLQETDKIIGLEDYKSVYNPAILDKVRSGKIYEVGNYDQLNLELLVNIHPDAIFESVSSMSGRNAGQLENLALRTIAIPAHFETHPLGRLEWIKFFALFFDKQQYADSIFTAIESSYLHTSQLTQSATHKPTVVAGYFSKGVWVAPGGKSYFAQLLKDAGADYIWKDDSTSGNIKLNYEQLLSKGLGADYFINIQMIFKEREQVLNEMPEIRSFKSISNNNFYMNNAMVNAFGKNNYWEQGFVEPQVILKDLGRIFHPELFPDYIPVYFK